MSAGTRPIEILVADDDEADVLLLRKALERCAAPTMLHSVENGAECLAFLRREPPFEEAPRPDLVLLDLQMPTLGGHETLTEICTDPKLRATPVVVLSTSIEPNEVRSCYEARASGYIRKPNDFETFERTVASLLRYWGETVTLPG